MVENSFFLRFSPFDGYEREISLKCSGEESYTQNIRYQSTRSHHSEGENRIRNRGNV